MENFPITVEQYLEHEQKQDKRFEFVNGYVFAMVGASRRHNLLTSTLNRLLGNHLEGTSCHVYVSDMKVKAGKASDEIFYYPDVMVACSRDYQDRYVEHKPKLIIEVLSPNTEKNDRLNNLEAYTQIPSLEEYMLVEQRDMKIDLYRRTGDQWQLSRYGEDNTLELHSVDYSVPVNSIYKSVMGVI